MRFCLLIAGLLFMISCVPNKKVLLLQKNDVNKKALPNDTIVRSYQLDSFQYRIQAHDILSVQVKSVTPKEFDFFSLNASQNGGNDLVTGELVDEKGEIELPMLGKIKVAGQTVFELQKTLQKLASPYVESPVVNVRLLNYRITLLGEVAKEGTVNLTNSRVSMLEAIAQGGGLGEFADRANVKLIRQKDGRTEVQYLNLLDENFMNSPYYYAYQNDLLIVAPLRQRPFKKYVLPNVSLLLSVTSIVILIINLSNKP